MGLIEEIVPAVSVAISITSDLSILGVEKSVNDDMMIQENDPDNIMSIGTVGVSSISVPITVAITALDKSQIVAEVISLGKETLKASVVVLADKNHSKVARSVFELECMPLYGSHSVCGKRPEMEDAVVNVPDFMKIPVKMLAADHIINLVNPNLNDLTAHFFGVYDGHGGFQVISATST